MVRNVPAAVRQIPVASADNPLIGPTLSVLDAAIFAGVSVPTAYRRVKSGAWPSFIIAGETRIPRAAIRSKVLMESMARTRRMERLYDILAEKLVEAASAIREERLTKEKQNALTETQG